MKTNLTTFTTSGRAKVLTTRRSSLPNETVPPSNPELSQNAVDLQVRKMSVVNLEAALANWKALEDNKVSQMSLSYRSHFSASLRITPSRTGGIPRNLMDHWFSPDS